jgi:peptidoglycan/LPS O-acetylase OafA/YrhL
MQAKERIYGLDILRALAILTVLIRHMFSELPISANKTLVDSLFLNGVDMFFVLSGFLIGGILLRRLAVNEPTFSGLAIFLRDRWLRTLPAYYAVLVVIVTLEVIYHHRPLFDFGALFIFSDNLNGSKFASFDESWSLAVEEWFYFVTPTMIFITCRVLPTKKAIPIVILMVFFFSNIVRIYRYYRYGIHDSGMPAKGFFFKNISSSVPTRIDNIMWGLLGSYLAFYKKRIWTSYKNLLFVVGIIGFLSNHFYRVFSDLNTYNILCQKQVQLFFILLTIPKLSAITKGRGKMANVITFIATISYSIYLVHATLFAFLIRPRFSNSAPLQTAAYFSWAFGGAYLLHITIERWGLKIREIVRAKSIGYVPNFAGNKTGNSALKNDQKTENLKN